MEVYGTAGGPTPADRCGADNVLLARAEARFDEPGRNYERQRDVFLPCGYYAHVTPGLPSGRTVTHTGGGLAINSPANNHTDTVVLTAGGKSYVLERTVFDRTDRTTAVASDNAAVATVTLDGAGRATGAADALGNRVVNQFDANGNTVYSTVIELCTISDTIAAEKFSKAAAFDVLNRPIVLMSQGADGTLNTAWPMCCSDTPTSTLITYLGWDSRGNKTNLVDPKLNTSIQDFDGASRRLRELRHLRPSGDGTTPVSKTVVTQWALDANGNLVRMVDDNGGISAWAFDLLDRNLTITFHDGSVRTNVFNPAGNVIGYTDENGSVFTNTFDVLGQMVGVGINPAAGVAGNAGTGVTGTLFQTFQFDGLRRLTFSRDSTGTFGLPTLVNADAGFSHDSIDRILEEQQAYAGGAASYVTRQAWTSLAGTGFTFPNNRQLNVGFDALYRKNAINEGVGGANIAAWDFVGSRIATVALGNGIVTSFMNNAQTSSAIQAGVTPPPWGTAGDLTADRLGYDGARRPIAKRHMMPGGGTPTALLCFTSAYDPSANKLFERPVHAESRASLYTNDSMDRLIQYMRGTLAPGGGSIASPITLPHTDYQRAYNLDGLGNWTNTSYIPESGTIPQLELRTHNKLNQLAAFGVAPASTAVLYDHGNNTAPNASRGNGNIINDGTILRCFDALNRLRQASDIGFSGIVILATYACDCLGRRAHVDRLASALGSIPVWHGRFIYDGQRIVEEIQDGGGTTMQYVWGQYIDELVQLKTYGNAGPQPLNGIFYLLSDLLYRSAALTDTSPTPVIAEAYDTSAYGDTMLFTTAGTGGNWFADDALTGSFSACRYVFTGREYDVETGNYFYRARYYVPALGRFTGRDPMGVVNGCGLYEYVASSPTAFLDPRGTTLQVVPDNKLDAVKDAKVIAADLADLKAQLQTVCDHAAVDEKGNVTVSAFTDATTKTYAGCCCLKKVVDSKFVWTITGLHMGGTGGKDWPQTIPDDPAGGRVRGPGKQGKPGAGTGGKIQVPVKGTKVVFQARDKLGKWMDTPNWLVTGHEICGHAMHFTEGSHWLPYPGHSGNKGDRPEHDQAIMEENTLAAEHNLPPRGMWGDPEHGESGTRPLEEK